MSALLQGREPISLPFLHYSLSWCSSPSPSVSDFPRDRPVSANSLVDSFMNKLRPCNFSAATGCGRSGEEAKSLNLNCGIPLEPAA